jgi:hypothetical protein
MIKSWRGVTVRSHDLGDGVLLADAAGMARDAEKDGKGHIRSRGYSGREFRVDRVVIAGAACVFLIARARRISPSPLPLSQTLAGTAVHELAEDGAEAGCWCLVALVSAGKRDAGLESGARAWR